ncbi:MAG: NapC/NirT family cytochrome c [Deltaproteobacteria bacterium]|nr:NapC/NirT family cytochrome c [Deltaproteobacteria bacterium]
MKTVPTAFFYLSRRGKILVVIAMLLVMGAGVFAYRGYRYVQHDPRFCRSCHIMEEPFQKWSTSPHHLVDCHQCHQQGTGEKLRQAWFYITRRPDKVVHHPELNHTVCAQCHLSDDPQWKRVGKTAGHQVHFKKAKIECIDCHLGGVHKFLRPVDSCIKCHTDKTEGPGKKMAFLHCTDCHNFLAEKEGLTPDRATCLGCHQKIRVGEESFPADAPMSSFDCAVCHKPHEKLRPDQEVCLTCHADVAPPHHEMGPNASCTECHKSHRWKVRQES